MFCVLVCAFWTLQSRSAREIDYLRYQMSTMTSKIKCLNTWLKVVYPTHSTCLPINNLYPHSIKHPKLRLIPSKLGERKTNLALLPRWKIDRPTPQRSSCLGVVIYQSNCVFVGWLDKWTTINDPLNLTTLPFRRPINQIFKACCTVTNQHYYYCKSWYPRHVFNTKNFVQIHLSVTWILRQNAVEWNVVLNTNSGLQR